VLLAGCALFTDYCPNGVGLEAMLIMPFATNIHPKAAGIALSVALNNLPPPIGRAVAATSLQAERML